VTAKDLKEGTDASLSFASWALRRLRTQYDSWLRNGL